MFWFFFKKSYLQESGLALDTGLFRICSYNPTRNHCQIINRIQSSGLFTPKRGFVWWTQCTPPKCSGFLRFWVGHRPSGNLSCDFPTRSLQLAAFLGSAFSRIALLKGFQTLPISYPLVKVRGLLQTELPGSCSPPLAPPVHFFLTSRGVGGGTIAQRQDKSSGKTQKTSSRAAVLAADKSDIRERS